ncbi:MAG: HypC/HybG/HupF family hydrogenase formation chaperone [Dehalococcoidia bacterium]|nr:HypC/HybG/HupF family hydrogenase formation chaperone [Dehalococcoidia bacterium]
MCVAVPALIISLDGMSAEVDIEGIRRRTSIYLVPEAKVGDYVIMHAGFAIRVMDMKEAHETIALLKEINATGN